MKWMMGLIEFWDRKVKELTIWDLKLVQIWTFAWALLIVKIFPCIVELSI